MKLNQILLNTLILSAGCCSFTYSQTITTVAGTIGSPGYMGDYGPANNAKFNNPRAVATDNSGNVYVADMRNYVIRKINPTGTISTVAGNGTSGNGGAGGPAISAQLNQPTGMTIDNEGNIYIADYNASVIKKVTTAGMMTIFAGNGTEGFSGDGGQAANAKLYRPVAVAIDGAGNLYISDASNKVVRKVNKAGIISTVAGIPGRSGYSGDGGPATQAKLTQPAGIAADNQGNIYIADPSNSVIRKVNSAGIISTFAGNGTAGYSGDGGPATKAQFQIGSPQGIAVDNEGNVYASDYQNHVIRKIDIKGTISTIAGTGAPDYAGDGGPAILAQIWYPIGIATDNAGNVFITDSYNNTIREIKSSCTAPAPSFNTQPTDKSVCKNSNVVFSVTTNNADTYQWQVNTGFEWTDVTDGNGITGATSTNLTIGQVTSTMNKYKYRCVATNTCRSTFSSTAVLNITGALSSSLAISTPSVNICAGAPVTFTAKAGNTGGNATYQWQVNGISAGTNSPIFKADSLANGDKINCVLTSASGSSCGGADLVTSNNIVVNVKGAPSVTAKAATKIYEGQRVQLMASGSGIVKYRWSPVALITDPLVQNPIAKPLKTTTFKVTGTAANGCSATSTITVTVEKKGAAQKTLSPNGDGSYDVFKIPFDNAYTFKTISITNEKGEVVFQTKDAKATWDGTFNGAPAEAGTYNWVITGTSNTTYEKVTKKDTFQLVR
jgi:gliding motility-associated-like protein